MNAISCIICIGKNHISRHLVLDAVQRENTEGVILRELYLITGCLCGSCCQHDLCRIYIYRQKMFDVN